MMSPLLPTRGMGMTPMEATKIRSMKVGWPYSSEWRVPALQLHKPPYTTATVRT